MSAVKIIVIAVLLIISVNLMLFGMLRRTINAAKRARERDADGR